MASKIHAKAEFYVIEKNKCLSCFFTVLWPFLRVLIFLDHPVFHKFQCGFRKDHSCHTSLTEVKILVFFVDVWHRWATQYRVVQKN